MPLPIASHLYQRQQLHLKLVTILFICPSTVSMRQTMKTQTQPMLEAVQMLKASRSAADRLRPGQLATALQPKYIGSMTTVTLLTIWLQTGQLCLA